MTQLFRDMRLYGNSECFSTRRCCGAPVLASRVLIVYRLHNSFPVVVLLLTATVLGITAYWASIFLPDIRRTSFTHT